MGAKSWEKQPSGPDWTDVFILMKAIEGIHGVLVTVTLASTVFEGPSGLSTIAAMRVDKDASVLGQPIVALSAEWPCKVHKDLVNCVFDGLYHLDRELDDKLVEQKRLA